MEKIQTMRLLISIMGLTLGIFCILLCCFGIKMNIDLKDNKGVNISIGCLIASGISTGIALTCLLDVL